MKSGERVLAARPCPQPGCTGHRPSGASPRSPGDTEPSGWASPCSCRGEGANAPKLKAVATPLPLAPPLGSAPRPPPPPRLAGLLCIPSPSEAFPRLHLPSGGLRPLLADALGQDYSSSGDGSQEGQRGPGGSQRQLAGHRWAGGSVQHTRSGGGPHFLPDRHALPFLSCFGSGSGKCSPLSNQTRLPGEVVQGPRWGKTLHPAVHTRQRRVTWILTT